MDFNQVNFEKSLGQNDLWDLVWKIGSNQTKFLAQWGQFVFVSKYTSDSQIYFFPYFKVSNEKFDNKLPMFSVSRLQEKCHV